MIACKYCNEPFRPQVPAAGELPKAVPALAEAQECIAALEEKLRKGHAEAEARSTEHAWTEKAFRDLQTEYGRQQTEMQTLQAQLQQANDQLQQAASQKDQLTTTKSELEKKEATLAEEAKTKAALEAALAVVRDEREETRRKAETVAGEAEKVRVESDRLREELAVLRTRLDVQAEETNRLDGERQAAVREAAMLWERLATLEADVKGHTAKEDERQRHLQTAETARTERERDAEQLRGALAALQAERDQLRTQHEEAIAAAGRGEQEHTERHNRLAAELDQTRKRAEELTEQVRTLTEQLQHLHRPEDGQAKQAEAAPEAQQKQAALARENEWLRREMETLRQTLFNLGIEV